MNVLILHGIMGHAGENWSQWLADELAAKGVNVEMPNLPDANHPDRTTWLAFVCDILNELGDETVVVAHSLSVATMLDFLEQHTGKLRSLICVSGFADDYGMELNSYFMSEKDINFEQVNSAVSSKAVLYGSNDPYVPQASLQLLAENLRVEPIVVKEGGHLNEAAGFSKFPKLLEMTLGIINS